MEKLSITRALTELKTLNARIDRKIDELIPLDLTTPKFQGKALKTNKTVEQFNKDTKADYESLNDLIKRRTALKAAITLSNAITKVKILSKEMTVAECIEYKALLPYKTKLLSRLKTNRSVINKEMEQARLGLEQSLQNMLQQSAGKDRKANPDEYDAIAKPFIEHNKTELVDPLKIDEEIKKLDEEITKFTQDIDIVLSESNSKTEIEI